MTTVSVIVPAFDAEATLRATVRSILAQTHRDLEIFIVDDGSRDRTGDIARELAADDDRIQVLHQPNAGVAAARNLALAQATGRYTAWIDADDLWHPTKIEKQLAVFRDAPEPPGFVYTGYRLIDSNDRIIPNLRTLADMSGHTVCLQIATNFFSNVSSIMIRTDLARAMGGHDPRLRDWGVEGSEDLLLQLRLSLQSPAACCPQALVGYRMHQRNMSLDYRRATQANLKALDLITGAAPTLPDWVFRLGRARVAGYALHALRAGDLGAAWRILARIAPDQPLFTLLTLWLMIWWQITAPFQPQRNRDPDLGRDFLTADPATAPWHGPMLLTRHHRRRLNQADRARARLSKCAAVQIERGALTG